MKNLFKKSNYILAAFVSAVSLFTIALGNTNVLAQSSCINADCAPSSNPAPAKPALTLKASTDSVAYGGTTILSWSAANVTSCLASNGWAGVKSVPTGSETSTQLFTPTTFTLRCSGPRGEVSSSVSVSVVQPNTLSIRPTLSIGSLPFESRLVKTNECVLYLLLFGPCIVFKTDRVIGSYRLSLVRSGDVSKPATVGWTLEPSGGTPVTVSEDRNTSRVRPGDKPNQGCLRDAESCSGFPVTPSSGTFTFAANSRSASMLINAKNDLKFESEKEFFKACIDPTKASGVYVGSSKLCTESYVRDDDGPCEDNAVSQLDYILRLGCVIALDTVVLTFVVPVSLISALPLGALAIAQQLFTGKVEGLEKATASIQANLNTFNERVRRATTAFLDNPSFFSLPMF